MSAGSPNSYDAVPYEGFPLPETHPDRLSALARLFGLTAPALGTCRVLELGCGSGGNLIPMALSLPDAEFVGIDLSRRQIDQGQATIDAIGLRNIELRAESILDVHPERIRPFDFIVCHGVYSWVPPEVQDQILRICGGGLTAHGVAYVSYNTYPGWHLREVARGIMRVHTRHLADPSQRVREGRAVLESLAEALGDGDDPYSLCLRDEAAQIRTKPDYYLLHEHFEDANRPLYVYEFLGRAANHGLRYLAESRLGSMASAQPTEWVEALSRHLPDPLDREQYCDFLAGRRFRQTLLCRAGVHLDPAPSASAIADLRASAVSQPDVAPPGDDPAAEETFRSPDGEATLTTSDTLIRTMMRVLGDAWPRSLPFEDLWTRTQARLGRPAVAGGPDAEPSRADLTEALLECLTQRVVELHVHEPRLAAEPGDRPLGAPWRVTRRGPGPASRTCDIRAWTSTNSTAWCSTTSTANATARRCWWSSRKRSPEVP